MSRYIDEINKRVRAAISDSNGWSTLLTFTTANAETFTQGGLATVHSQNFDQEGLPIISTNSHILFSEEDVNAQGIVTRVDGILDLEGWVVEFDHKVGHVKAELAEPEPDETLGVIRVKLTNYE